MNLSQHVPSGSSRPPSSLSRPSSSASHRTGSRFSQRPASRISQRPSGRQSARVAPSCQTLVSQLTGMSLENNRDGFSAALEIVTKKIDSVTRQAVSLDMSDVEAHLKRLAKRAHIESHDALAEALNISVKRLLVEAEKSTDLDTELKISKLPDHLQMLIALSMPATSSSLRYAEQLVDRTHNPLLPSTGLTWQDILAEEPFEGQHWEGAYGLTPGSLAIGFELYENSDSSPPLSPGGSDLDDKSVSTFTNSESSESVEPSQRISTPLRMRTNVYTAQECHMQTLILRNQLESLQSQQYWRDTWRTDDRLEHEFNLNEPSTLGPSFQRVSGAYNNNIYLSNPENERYINEHDVVRDTLIALQGRQNITFTIGHGKERTAIITVSPTVPRLMHITPLAQHSILSSFARLANTMAQLRWFCQTVISSTTDFKSDARTNPSRTLEAFAEAIEGQMRRFHAWCASKEERILRAHLPRGVDIVVSLLDLEKSIHDEFSDTYSVLLDILGLVFPKETLWDETTMFSHVKSSPSSFASRLLDALFSAVHSRHSYGDGVSSAALMQTFVQTAEPIWLMLGRWLNDGIFMAEGRVSPSDHAVPEEFFIESNDFGVGDPDFWTEGFGLRSPLLINNETNQSSGVPAFLRLVAEKLLSAGKSIGLLRILGQIEDVGTTRGKLSAATWPTFEQFILGCVDFADNSVKRSSPLVDVSAISNMSTDDLSLLLSDRLLPICLKAEKTMQEILFSECALLHHLFAIEDLFLMRKGDVMADFCNVLFSGMDNRLSWTDFHFLNTAFRDVVDSMRTRWIDSSLVRLSYKPHKHSQCRLSVRNLEGLVMEYGIPFPLVFIFGERSSQIYNGIFVLLLQIKRAKSALDSILVRGSAMNLVRSQNELKVFYATRSKLSWFVNTILTFISSNILQVEVQNFHEKWKSADSLDDVIGLHNNHLDILEKRCFLHEKMSSLHLAISSILDMSIVFSDLFIAFAGDTTFDASRVSTSRSRRYRSRRLRHESRNTVSFSNPVPVNEDEDSSDSDFDESIILEVPARDAMPSFASSTISDGEVDFFRRNEKMSTELDLLVRYVRRGVENFAVSAEGIQSFEILAFSLQDWDI